MSIRLKHVRRKSLRWPLVHTLLASTLSLASLPALAQEIIPLERKITWQAGVDGGIPTVAVEENVLDHGAVADGVTDDAQAFKDAIAALPAEGGAVLAPAGTYLLKSTISLDAGTVLRGEGADNTVLRCDLTVSGDCIRVLTYERGAWTDVESGHDKGSTTLTVADTSTFVVPTFAEIQQTNDPDVMYTNPAWDVEWADDSVGEIVQVIGKSSSTLTLADPLHFSYDSNMDPVVRKQDFVEWVGIEDLYIERLAGVTGNTVYIHNAAWVWVSGVESAFTEWSHFQIGTVYGCELRDSYIHHSHEYIYGGYGINLSLHATNCLIENNIFVKLRHSMLAQLGANGNVFAYNYSREAHVTGDLPLSDISVHGHYPFYNLFEGNIVQEVAVSDYWGPVGPNTFLRNCIQFEGLLINDESHDQNIIGNTLTDKTQPSPTANDIRVVAGVNGTIIHGNWVEGAIQWDPGIINYTIPDSYYLKARPSFYGTGDWPSIGSDLGPVCTNPAFERWVNHEETPGVNSSPYTPGNPSPADGSSENFVETVLSWSGEDPDGDPVTYDVFLAPNDETPEVQVCSAITSTTCDPPGDLLNSTLYYWKVIAKDDRGAESTSATWSISTITNDDVGPDDMIFDGGFE